MANLLRPRRRHAMACCSIVWLLSSNALTLTQAQLSRTTKTSHTKSCERLKTSLTYTQEKAPRDISGVLPVVVEKVNRELEGVVDVMVEWTGGELHRRVGEHVVQCSVVRLLSAVGPDATDEDAGEVQVDEHGRRVVEQCFHVPFTILDTDECVLPVGHALRHQCQEPATCVNTVGSYECLCPSSSSSTASSPISTHSVPRNVNDAFWETLETQHRSPWEQSYNATSESSCPGKASTHNCCAEAAHSPEGTACRSAFVCPKDPCTGEINDCASTAKCSRKTSPLSRPNYECSCPSGFMGTGHKCRPGIDAKPQPRVMFDGVTPTEETVRNNFYCGCTKPVVDACAGFPPCKGKHEICTITAGNTPMCACEPGYVDDDDGYGCVDETPPILKLRHDPDGNGVNRLKQGDVYKEYAVDIMDENAEDYLRSLKITYSQPLPPGCLAHIGSFHVNYTVATPWTSPPYARVTRKVIIEDIDECSLDPELYTSFCPELVPQCDTEAGAKCVNTNGSYTCKCPKYTTGDGFRDMSSFLSVRDSEDIPEGYHKGNGCSDTSKPSITLLGPNPKVFKVCKCGGLNGIMGGKSDRSQDKSMAGDQRELYEHDIKEMIHSSVGAELCATHAHPNPSAADCVTAKDLTFRGSVDLTSRITIGDPVKESALQWKVPYNVMDDAGNVAPTVWRKLVVEEVDLYDMESRIRADVVAEKDAQRKAAVKKAVEEEKRRGAAAMEVEMKKQISAQKNGNNNGQKCQTCPPCDCSKEKFDTSRCDSYCKLHMEHTCTAGAEGVTMSASKISKGKFTTPFLSILHWLESVLPASLILIVFICSTGVVAFLMLRWCLIAIVNPTNDSYYYTNANEERARVMQNSVEYFHSPEPGSGPVRSSMSVGRNDRAGGSTTGHQGNGLFSPQENRRYGNDRFVTSPPFSPPGQNGGSSRPPADDDIYQTMSPITPAKGSGSQPQMTPGGYNLRRRY